MRLTEIENYIVDHEKRIKALEDTKVAKSFKKTTAPPGIPQPKDSEEKTPKRDLDKFNEAKDELAREIVNPKKDEEIFEENKSTGRTSVPSVRGSDE